MALIGLSFSALEIPATYKEAEQAGRSDLSFTDDYPKFRYLVAFMVRPLKSGWEMEN